MNKLYIVILLGLLKVMEFVVTLSNNNNHNTSSINHFGSSVSSRERNCNSKICIIIKVRVKVARSSNNSYADCH